MIVHMLLVTAFSGLLLHSNVEIARHLSNTNMDVLHFIETDGYEQYILGMTSAGEGGMSWDKRGDDERGGGTAQRNSIHYNATAVHKNITCNCIKSFGSSTGLSAESSAARGLLEEYLQFTQRKEGDKNKNEGYSAFSPHSTLNADASCTIYDFTRKEVWMISDWVGSTPIWYSIHHSQYTEQRESSLHTQAIPQEPRLIVTTDLISAVKLGFKQPTPLGPAQVICINLYNFEIQHISRRNVFTTREQKEKYKLTNPDYYADRLVSASLQALSSPPVQLSNFSVPVSIEVDRTASISILLQCSLSSLGVGYNIIYSRALVADIPSEYPRELLAIIDDSKLDDYTNPTSIVWRARCTLYL